MATERERIGEALTFVDPTDRDIWVRMGMAIKSELGERGFADWDNWSQQAASYDPKAAREVWRSLRPDGSVRIGTLFHAAKANGWQDDGSGRTLSRTEPTDRTLNSAEHAAAEAAEIARERADTQAKAKAIWQAATAAGDDHPYLARKQVAPVSTLREIEASQAAMILGYAPRSGGQPLTGRLLVVPVKQGERLSTLELIDGDGRKTALAGRGTKVGGYWATEKLPKAPATLLIGEGVATVLSTRQASGHPGIAALSAGNLPSVAQAMRKRYPTAKLVILADRVKATGEPDPHAIQSAKAVGGKLAIPDFGGDREPDWTDFNDLSVHRGLEAVRVALANAAPPGEDAAASDDATPRNIAAGWPPPQALAAKHKPEPYPLDALPDTLRAAVEEVAAFVKAPVPVVASSAIASLSLAVQGQADVVRAEKLQGPTGLFLLTIADSGERKSTCDSFFLAAVRDYQARQAEAAKPALKDHKADIDAWECKRTAIKDRIRQLTKDDKPTERMESALRELEHRKPEPPRIPRLLHEDTTPESLAFDLAKEWPSGGVISAEAGIVFGSHGMGKDSVMRNLALLNQLWDGSSLSIDRRTTESFVVKGARLTMALQVQEATLREFFAKTGALARGTGFMARFLLAWPESTQGFRPFTDPPATWPQLAAFHRRIAALLESPVPMDADGALTPAALPLTPDAKLAWIEFHDLIEAQLVSGGELYDVRDVASKSADNAARLAALFQVFEHGPGPIRWECFTSASRLVAWHLTESRRFFGELNLPAELSAAVRLDDWLLEHCRRAGTRIVSKNHVRQHGPLRDRERLEAAIRELDSLDRLMLVKEGKRLTLRVNPALVRP